MKMYSGVEVYLHVLLTLAVDRGEWLLSHSARMVQKLLWGQRHKLGHPTHVFFCTKQTFNLLDK
jgi:hypothetical protein